MEYSVEYRLKQDLKITVSSFSVHFIKCHNFIKIRVFHLHVIFPDGILPCSDFPAATVRVSFGWTSVHLSLSPWSCCRQVVNLYVASPQLLFPRNSDSTSAPLVSIAALYSSCSLFVYLSGAGAERSLEMDPVMSLMVFVTPVVFCYSSGQVTDSCKDMQPHHYGLTPQTEPPPYVLTTDSVRYRPGEVVKGKTQAALRWSSYRITTDNCSSGFMRGTMFTTWALSFECFFSDVL